MSHLIDPGVMSHARAQLASDGQTVIRNLVPAETVARWRSLVGETTSQMDALELPPGNEVYQQAFEQYMNLWEFDERCREIALDPHLGSAAAALLDVESVRLYHDQALIKVGRGGHTPWHQDQWYWPLDTNRTITMWLALHDIDAEMGELEFALGTHVAPIEVDGGGAPISSSGSPMALVYSSRQATNRWPIDSAGSPTQRSAKLCAVG